MDKLTVILSLGCISSLNAFDISSVDKNIPNDTKATGCQVDIKLLPPNTPLLLDFTNKDIIYPDQETTIISFSSKEQIEIACPGASKINVDNANTSDVATASCVSGLEFKVDDQVVSLDTILCSSRIKSTARYTGKSCWKVGKEIEVGFDIRGGHFLRQYTTCFDDNLRNVIYSYHVISKLIEDAITGSARPTWTEDDFYNLGEKMNNIYPHVAQRPTINKQLGLDDDDTKYVKSTGQYYIAVGHLTAKTDLVYNAQQTSTFHYINTAPQWQTFNGHNWYYFERNLRLYAANNLVDLEVYTGTYGISTLPHEITGEEVELYLYVDENNNKALPIPELFWKIAYDPLNKAGVVVLGINNPYQMNIEKSIICNDIADELSWLTFDRFILNNGFIYACTIDDFRKVYPRIPQFDVQDILK